MEEREGGGRGVGACRQGSGKERIIVWEGCAKGQVTRRKGVGKWGTGRLCKVSRGR